MLNLIIFPFHSMRKNQKDGFRNRDGHFIESLSSSERVGKVLAVNRPTTYAEVIYSRMTWKTKGEVIKKTGQARLVKLSEKLYAVDYLSYDVVGNVTQKKNWFWKAYSDPAFIAFINDCIDHLGLTSFSCTYHNVYASAAAGLLKADVELFDAFDNWLKFPMFESIYPALRKGYKEFAEKANLWITNSEENKRFFEHEFSVRDCVVLKNGVDVGRFSRTYSLPHDMKTIGRPIIGFGGTITHLFDEALFNKIVADHPDKQFVIVGKVLDKHVFARLHKAPNLHFLGDKHYDEYAAYVRNFDICIITYHSGNKAHGGDSLKFYEYLAAGKNMVSTSGNGIFKAHDAVFIADNYDDFSSFINVALQTSQADYRVPAELTWQYKANWLISRIIETKSGKENSVQ